MRIHHIALTVRDLEISKEFYTKYFDFKELFSFQKEDLKGRAIFLQGENLKLELWEFENTSSSSINFPLNSIGIRHISFFVDDLQKFVLQYQKSFKIGEIQVGSNGGKYVFIKDPSGVDIELYQPPKELV